MSVNNEFSALICEKINNIFSDLVGPVAFILCDEVYEKWLDENMNSNGRISVRLLKRYVEMLSAYIECDEDKETFIQQSNEIDAINYYK